MAADAKKAFRAAVKRTNTMRKADGKTSVTCPASRHAQMIAELIGRRSFAMVHDEPEHCAASILSAVGSLYEARLMIAMGVSLTEDEADALLRAADYMSEDGASMPVADAARIAAVLRSMAITHGSSPAAADLCRKCGGAMKPGKAIAQTVECSDEGTCSPAGPGMLVDCMKCERCGWSVSAGENDDGS